jgi:hypothetical protein
MEQKIEKSIVKHKVADINIVRNSRGYSISELKQSGINNVRFARNNGLTIDKLRKTIYSENVERLKPFVEKILESQRKKNDTRKAKTTSNKKPKKESGPKRSATKKTRKTASTTQEKNKT